MPRSKVELFPEMRCGSPSRGALLGSTTDPDHHRGLRVHLQAVKRLIRGWLADHGLIHPGRLGAALDAAAAGIPARFGEIESAVAAEAWARAVATGPAVRWTRHLLLGVEEI